MPVAFLNFCISGFSAKPDAISPFCKDRSAFPFPRCCQKHGIFFICPFIEIAAHIRIKPGNSVTFLLCHQHQQKKTAKHHAQNPKAAAQKQDSIFPEPEYFGELFVWYGKGAKSRQSRHRHRDRTDQIGTDRRLSDDQAAYDVLPAGPGMRSPASRRSSKDSSIRRTSAAVGNGTPLLASAMERIKLPGRSCG